MFSILIVDAGEEEGALDLSNEIDIEDPSGFESRINPMLDRGARRDSAVAEPGSAPRVQQTGCPLIRAHPYYYEIRG